MNRHDSTTPEDDFADASWGASPTHPEPMSEREVEELVQTVRRGMLESTTTPTYYRAVEALAALHARLRESEELLGDAPSVIQNRKVEDDH